MHRIPRHEGKCRAFHGHRYAAEIVCTASDLDDVGRVVDFGVIKQRVGAWIDEHWDHTGILWKADEDIASKVLANANAQHGRPIYLLEDPPTVENIAAELGRVATNLLSENGVEVLEVRIWETPNCSAIWRAEGTV